MVATRAPFLVGRIDVGPIRPVGQHLAGRQDDPGGDPPQHVGTPRPRPLDHLTAVEATVQQQQHPRTDTPQQADRAHPLTGVAGPEAGIEDGVRAALAQIDPLHLREGTGATVAMMPPEGPRIGGRVRDVLGGAINGHQPQAEAEGTRRLLGGQRPAHAMEQGHHGPCPQPRARLANGALVRQHDIRVRPEQPQAMRQLVQHHLQRLLREQAHRHTQQQRHVRRQLAPPLRRVDRPCGGGLRSLRAGHPLQGLQRQRVRELGGLRPLAYHKAHEMTPFGGDAAPCGSGKSKDAILPARSHLCFTRLSVPYWS